MRAYLNWLLLAFALLIHGAEPLKLHIPMTAACV
jgi:hypothetical protein